LQNGPFECIFIVETLTAWEEAYQMLTKITKWGNSLAIRIPKAIAGDANLKLNRPVDVIVKDGVIVLKPVKTARVSLKSLVEQIREDQLHGEIETGSPVGREIW